MKCFSYKNLQRESFYGKVRILQEKHYSKLRSIFTAIPKYLYSIHQTFELRTNIFKRTRLSESDHNCQNQKNIYFDDDK